MRSDIIERVGACLPEMKKKVLERETVSFGWLPFDDGYHDGYENGVEESFKMFEKLLTILSSENSCKC